MKLKLRWSDFTTVTRQTSLRAATQDPQVVGRVALKLLAEAWHPGQGVRVSQAVRLIGVGVSSLTPPLQLDLWDTGPAEDAARKKKEAVRKKKEAAREERVASALAAMEVKFGAGKIVRGSAVGKTRA